MHSYTFAITNSWNLNTRYKTFDLSDLSRISSFSLEVYSCADPVTVSLYTSNVRPSKHHPFDATPSLSIEPTLVPIETRVWIQGKWKSQQRFITLKVDGTKPIHDVIAVLTLVDQKVHASTKIKETIEETQPAISSIVDSALADESILEE